MKNDLTLVIMAAGMGSRFGGLKQIEPVGPSGEIIADYSVYDAIRAGFTKVVFIIRKENYDYFKENITKKYEDKIKVEFAFQELDMIPSDVTLPEGRVKMLGTGHAILCAKDNIAGNFVVINGDDFYGLDPYIQAKKFFENECQKNEYLMCTYPAQATMSENGAVKRGVCFIKDGFIEKIIESEVRDENGKVIARPLTNGEEFTIDPNSDVSMNFFGFQKEIFAMLEEKFDEFIHGEMTEKNEFLTPEVLAQLIKEEKIKGVVKKANSKWMGITYKEDVDEFKKNINKLIADGKYPSKLW